MFRDCIGGRARGQRHFFYATLIVTGGFLTSIGPVLITVPGPFTMADQFFMLIVMMTGCIVVAASMVATKCFTASAVSGGANPPRRIHDEMFIRKLIT